jgi:hypothetical protein
LLSQSIKGAAKMQLLLYHFTGRDFAHAIVIDGFAPVDRTFWFSPDPQSIEGEQLRTALLELVVELSEQQVNEFRKDVVWETIDPVSDKVIEDDFPEPPCEWFEIPGAVLKQQIVSCREVSLKERQELMR